MFKMALSTNISDALENHSRREVQRLSDISGEAEGKVNEVQQLHPKQWVENGRCVADDVITRDAKYFSH